MNPVHFQYPDEGTNSIAMLVKADIECGGGIGRQRDIVAYSMTCTHQGGPLTGAYKAAEASYCGAMSVPSIDFRFVVMELWCPDKPSKACLKCYWNSKVMIFMRWECGRRSSIQMKKPNRRGGQLVSQSDQNKSYLAPTSTLLPPVNAEVITTACDYCVVACGYKVYRWPVGSNSGGPRADENAFGVDFPVHALQAGFSPAT